MYTSIFQTVYNNEHANNLFRKVLLFKDFLKDLSDVHCWLAKFWIPPQEKKKTIGDVSKWANMQNIC